MFSIRRNAFHGIPMDENGLNTSYITKYKKQFNASILYTIPSFHNPTNFSMNAKKRIEVMEICNEVDYLL